MTRRTVVAIAIAVTNLSAAPSQRVFRTTVDTVVVDVSVSRGGEPVDGLTVADFRVTDNGVPQTIAAVSRETLPIDLTVVADLSATAEGPSLDALRRSVDDVLAKLRREDRASLIVFDQRIHEIDLGLRRLEIMVDSTWTAASPAVLYDATAAALIKPLDASRRRMVILFTEGKDQGSLLDERDLIDVATRSGATIFAVAVTDGTSRAPRQPSNLGLLERLTADTGGRLSIVQRDQDLSASFARAFEDFRTGYVLRYVPTGTQPTGWHTIEVGLLQQRGLEVRARKGYFY